MGVGVGVGWGGVGESVAKKERGGEVLKTETSPCFLVLRLAFIPAGTKTASPAPPALPLNPHQHALYHIHQMPGSNTHTHAEYMCWLLHLRGNEKQEAMGEGDDQ